MPDYSCHTALLNASKMACEILQAVSLKICEDPASSTNSCQTGKSMKEGEKKAKTKHLFKQEWIWTPAPLLEDWNAATQVDQNTNFRVPHLMHLDLSLWLLPTYSA